MGNDLEKSEQKQANWVDEECDPQVEGAESSPQYSKRMEVWLQTQKSEKEGMLGAW